MTMTTATPAPPPPEAIVDDLAEQAQALGEALLEAAKALREAPQRPDAQRQALRMLRLVHGWSALAARTAFPDDASAPSVPSAPPTIPPGEGDARRMADGGERLIGAAAQAALAQRHPQAAAWLAQRRPALTLHVVEFPAPEQVRRQTALARRLAAALQRHPPAPALLHLIRRALNRTPTLALRAEAQRKERGLTVEAAAAEVGIPADSFARYVRSGRGLTAEQRARVAAWAHPGDPGKRSGEALHAAAALEEIAARAGLTVDDGRAALEALIADLAPPLRAAGLLDGVRVTRPRRSPTVRAPGAHPPDLDAVEDEEDGLDLEVVHVWVSPDPPAAQFFTGGWVRLLLAERIRAHAPDADVLIDPVFHRSDGAVFSPALLAVRGDRALVAEPMTVRLRELAPLLVDGDPRRLVVVLAPLDEASGMDAEGMAQIGDAFGVTVTDLAGADAALAAALASALAS